MSLPIELQVQDWAIIGLIVAGILLRVVFLGGHDFFTTRFKSIALTTTDLLLAIFVAFALLSHWPK